MKARTAFVVLPLVLVLAGCGGGGEEEAGATSDAAAEEVLASDPEPDEAQAAELLEALAAIEPTLDEEQSVERAESMCDSILAEARGEGHPQYSLVELAQTRFTHPDRGELTDEQAQAVVDVIAGSAWCVEGE